MIKVGIVNYGMGNLTSVVNAVNSITPAARVLNRPSEVEGMSHLILPGVGAFGDAMSTLIRDDWVAAMGSHVQLRTRPFLGICLGMQLLASTGTEHGTFQGLDWIAGTVTKLEGAGVRVPHVGWNSIEVATTSGLFKGIDCGADFYFVHSYAFRPVSESVVTSWCDYGERFAASVQHENVHATQFHPEKSQKHGLLLLENFLKC